MANDGVIYALDVLRGLREIVAEFGPDTRRECTYLTYEDAATEEVPIAPHCIAGVFLHREGVPLSALQQCEGSTVDIVGAKLDEYVTVESGAMRLLRIAQNEQDNGNDWGEALEAAQREYDTPGYYGRF